MSIKDLIQEVFDKHEYWDYYSDPFSVDNIVNPQKCKEFINRFFSVSGKAGCLVDIVNIDELIKKHPERCQHIVYVFLLGIGIYNKNSKIKKNIDEKIQHYSQKYKCKSDVNFIFIWFLCCLFHDLGYIMEESGELNWSFKTKEIGNPVGVPRFYHNKILRYLNYRKNVCKMVDHGIYAGVHMYNTLCTIRSKQEKECDSNTRLSWEVNLIHIYNIASWIVLCHNIWITGDPSIYAKYGLSELLDNSHPIKLDRSPLFFFFCLIDSIEPIKKMKDISLLREIDIDISEKKIKISSNNTDDTIEDYLQSIKDIGKWLTSTRCEVQREVYSVIIDI
jgi:hypothetical protein